MGWIINHDMDDEKGNPTQWLNEKYSKTIIDLANNDMYLIGTFYTKTSGFYYFDYCAETLEEAINFAEEVWG